MSIMLSVKVVDDGHYIMGGGGRYSGYTGCALEATSKLVEVYDYCKEDTKYYDDGRIQSHQIPSIPVESAFDIAVDSGLLDWYEKDEKLTNERRKYADGAVTIDIGNRTVDFDSWMHFTRGEEEELQEDEIAKNGHRFEVEQIPDIVSFDEWETFAGSIQDEGYYRKSDGDLLVPIY